MGPEDFLGRPGLGGILENGCGEEEEGPAGAKRCVSVTGCVCSIGHLGRANLGCTEERRWDVELEGLAGGVLALGKILLRNHKYKNAHLLFGTQAPRVYLINVSNYGTMQSFTGVW